MRAPSPPSRSTCVHAHGRRVAPSLTALLLLQAPRAVMKELAQNCVRFNRRDALDLLFPLVLKRDGVDAAGRFLHGCNDETVERQLLSFKVCREGFGQLVAQLAIASSLPHCTLTRMSAQALSLAISLGPRAISLGVPTPCVTCAPSGAFCADVPFAAGGSRVVGSALD